MSLLLEDKKKAVDNFFVDQLKHTTLDDAERNTEEYRKFLDETEYNFHKDILKFLDNFCLNLGIITEEELKKIKEASDGK